MLVANVLVVAALLLSACAQPTPEVIREEVVVEKEVPVTVEVEKEVVVEKVVTATPQPTAAVPETRTGGTLTMGIANEPITLDPAGGWYVYEQLMLMNIYDPLIWADQENELHPGLATEWESNAEGTEFILKLRDDVKFHDGTPFDAAAVKAQFDRITDPDFVAATVGAIVADYKGTTVVDETTVKVAFSSPKPTFIMDLSRIWAAIPSPAAVAKWGEDFGQHPVGTGPFVFKEWAAQHHVTLVRNPDYAWGPEFATHDGPALLDEIVFRFLPEAVTRMSAFLTGELQVVEDPPYQDVSEVVSNPAYRLEQFSPPGMPAHMMINTEASPTNDIRVRQAMIYAVNQEELVQAAFYGMQGAAHSVLAPTTWSYDEQAANLYRYDFAKAQQLLDEAGWKDADGDGIREKDGEKLHVVYPASAAWEEAYMELLASYLNKVGFEVELILLDDAGIFEFGNAGKHHILGMGWMSRNPSVLDFVYNSANIEEGSSFTRFRSAELDQALNDAASTLDSEARRELYVQAQRIIMENALAIPLFTYDRVILLHSSVQDWRFDSEGYPWLYEVWPGQ